MSTATREPRSAVMILAEASWEDQSGTAHTIPARMEDKSASGACIRVKVPIQVGSKLRIQAPWEQFTGTTKYCRSEGREFMVGIQRDKSTAPGQPLPAGRPQREVAGSHDSLFAAAKIQNRPERQESQTSEILAPQPAIQSEPTAHLASRASATPLRRLDHEIDREGERKDKIHISRPRRPDASRQPEFQMKQLGKENDKERKPMKRKWLELAPWHHQPEGLGISGEVNAEGNGGGNGNGKSGTGNPALHASQPAGKMPAHVAEEAVTHFQADLLPLEDIYSAAGIVSLRKGYNINKVVEMLRSEHIRGLSKEMKRAVVLMALDVAGVSLEQVQQDAKAREQALDSYAAEQQKQAEVEWARKAEENIQIQADLERIKTHYTARITRNLDGVARQKSAFSAWLTMKQQEAQSISEAMELCLKPAVSDIPSAPLTNASAAASARPM